MNTSVAPAKPHTAPIRRIADVPGPRGLPLLGNMFQVEVEALHTQLEAWAAQYGPVYRVRLLLRDALVVSRPDLVAAIFRDRPDGWRRLTRVQTVIRETGSHGLFSAEGEEWRRQRRLVMSAFDPGHMKSYFPSLARVTTRLKECLDAAARSGEAIDLQPVLMRYTVDVVAGLAFGIDMNTQQDPDNALQRHLDKVFPMFARRVAAAFPLWRYVKLPADREFDRHLAALRAAAQGFIRAARGRMQADPRLHQHPSNLLEAMLAAQDSETRDGESRDEAGGRFTEEELIGNVFTMLLAGEDTTANTLCWTLYLLHTNRGTWDELVAEVDRQLGADPFPRSFEAARGLDAAERCASESMRLRPVAPFFFMENNRPATLDGIELPAGSFVICLTRPAAVDPLASADAAEFRPARWRPEAEGAVEAQAGASPRALLKASMPFGAGPRMCPGRYLALLQMNMVLATLARNYQLLEVATEDGSPPQERFAFTMFPLGLRMRIRPRSAQDPPAFTRP